jgi:hypothetical protein
MNTSYLYIYYTWLSSLSWNYSYYLYHYTYPKQTVGHRVTTILFHTMTTISNTIHRTNINLMTLASIIMMTLFYIIYTTSSLYMICSVTAIIVVMMLSCIQSWYQSVSNILICSSIYRYIHGTTYHLILYYLMTQYFLVTVVWNVNRMWSYVSIQESNDLYNMKTIRCYKIYTIMLWCNNIWSNTFISIAICSYIVSILTVFIYILCNVNQWTHLIYIFNNHRTVTSRNKVNHNTLLSDINDNGAIYISNAYLKHIIYYHNITNSILTNNYLITNNNMTTSGRNMDIKPMHEITFNSTTHILNNYSSTNIDMTYINKTHNHLSLYTTNSYNNMKWYQPQYRTVMNSIDTTSISSTYSNLDYSTITCMTCIPYWWHIETYDLMNTSITTMMTITLRNILNTHVIETHISPYTDNRIKRWHVFLCCTVGVPRLWLLYCPGVVIESLLYRFYCLCMVICGFLWHVYSRYF